MKLQRLRWLDCREVIPMDRPSEPSEIHPDDLRSAYFNFNVYRIMSAPQPPKPEKVFYLVLINVTWVSYIRPQFNSLVR